MLGLFFGSSSEEVETPWEFSCGFSTFLVGVVGLILPNGEVGVVVVVLLVGEVGVVVGVLLAVDVVLLVVGGVLLVGEVGVDLVGKRTPRKDAKSTTGFSRDALGIAEKHEKIISARGDEVSVLRLGQEFEFSSADGGTSRLSCLTGFSVELVGEFTCTLGNLKPLYGIK